MYTPQPRRDPPPHHERRRDKPPSVRDPESALSPGLDPVREPVALPEPRATANVRDWFSGRDADDLDGAFGGLSVGQGQGQGQGRGFRDGWRGPGGGGGGYRGGGSGGGSEFARGWKQPRFQPSPVYDKMLAKERMLPPKLGGRSKKDLLGSINDCWGPIDEFADLDEERRGMFEVLEDPPSRSTSPFRVVEEEDLKLAKVRAWERARAGTVFQPEEQEERQAQHPHLHPRQGQDQDQDHDQDQGLVTLRTAATGYAAAQDLAAARSFSTGSTSARSPPPESPGPPPPTINPSNPARWRERSTTATSTQHLSLPPPTEPDSDLQRPHTPPAPDPSGAAPTPATESIRKDQTAEYHAWLAHTKRRLRDESKGGGENGGGDGGGEGDRREWA